MYIYISTINECLNISINIYQPLMNTPTLIKNIQIRLLYSFNLNVLWEWLTTTDPSDMTGSSRVTVEQFFGVSASWAYPNSSIGYNLLDTWI